MIGSSVIHCYKENEDRNWGIQMKKPLLLLLSASCILLAGCSQVQDYAAEKMIQASLISEDEDYREYIKLEKTGSLDEDGFYRDAPVETEEQPSGSVHVTFAENQYLDIVYYYDAELTEPIDTRQCYLMPGDSIYAPEPMLKNPYSDKYQFSEYRIWQYDSAGSRSRFPAPEGGEAKLLLTIPKDFTGTGLSIEPLGKYEERALSLSDYYLDKAGKQIELNGHWTVDNVTTDSDSAQISPLVPYTVNYDFSQYCGDYYFYTSSPESYYDDNESGKVVFYEVSPQDSGAENYSVQLHRYMTATVVNESAAMISALTSHDSIQAIEVNGKAIEVFGRKEQTIPQLKHGDKIVVRVGSAYEVASSLGTEITQVELSGGYEYTLTVPDTLETEFTITVSKSGATHGGYVPESIPNATITVTDSNGNALESGVRVEDNEKVTVTITPAEGYCITGKKVKGNVYQDTMKYKDYDDDIDAIIEDHPVTQAVLLALDDSDDYGICVFKLDGQEVSGRVSVREGQKLELTYTLTDERYEIVRESGIGAFAENLLRKNKITVSIEITEDLNGKTICREDYIELTEA